MKRNGHIRILRVITRMNIGGPSIHVGVLSRQLNHRRYRTIIVAGVPEPSEGDMTPSIRGHLVQLRWLQRAIHPWKDLVTWWMLVHVMRRYRPHIVHTHMAKAGALGRSAAWVTGLARRPCDRPVILHTFHGHVLDGYFSRWRSRLFRWIEWMLARMSHRLIAVSRSVKSDLVTRRIAPADKINVIPLGLPLDRFLNIQRVERPATEDLVVAWVGRLVPIKCVDLFIASMAQLRSQYLPRRVRAIIVGDGPERAATETAIAAHGVGEIITCCGWVLDMAALYAQVDVVCLTSRNEGTPVALIEAMAAGVPVVATAVGGVPDVLGVDTAMARSIPQGQCLQGIGGLLVPVADAQGCSAALAQYATRPALRAAAGTAGRAAVRERYAAQRLVHDVEELYDACSR